MKAQVQALLRLGVAAAISYLLALAAKQGLPVLPDPTVQAIVAAITGVLWLPVNGALNWLASRVPFLNRIMVAHVAVSRGGQPAAGRTGR